MATALRRHHAAVEFHLWPGGHDGTYWRSHVARYLGFYVRTFAGCH
jgi:enterochelin esterase-like enzyme